MTRPTLLLLHSVVWANLWELTTCSAFYSHFCIQTQAFGKWTALLAKHFMMDPCMTYYSGLKMEVTCFSKMSADFKWTTQHYGWKDRTLYIYLNLITQKGYLFKWCRCLISMVDNLPYSEYFLYQQVAFEVHCVAFRMIVWFKMLFPVCVNLRTARIRMLLSCLPLWFKEYNRLFRFLMFNSTLKG
jgi:hypothetical protein